MMAFYWLYADDTDDKGNKREWSVKTLADPVGRREFHKSFLLGNGW